MVTRPVERYWNYGLSFRWMRGESVIPVKRGYVIEGRSVISVRPPVPGINVQDRPHEDVVTDQHTWLMSISADSSQWGLPNALISIVDKWAANNPRVADLKQYVRYPTVRSTGCDHVYQSDKDGIWVCMKCGQRM